jgi:carboxyl-terminal processing protease
MLPASNRGVGTAIHFPDVCKTAVPPAVVPIPYPDLAMNAMAVPFSPNIFVGFVPATNMASMKMMTMGDEAGAIGGLITGAIKMQGNTIVGNPTVLWNNLPAEHLLVPTAGNNFNAMLGAQLVPSVTSTFVCLRQRGGEADGADGLETERLATRVEDLALLERGRRADNVTASRDGDRLVLRIRLFDDDVVRCVFNHLTAHEGPVAIDLRDNRGGDAEAALALADDFLADGLVMARALDGDDDEEPCVSLGPASYEHTVEIWIDAGTASAAELFAAALVDHGRASLVGERSYGKATAQALVAAPGDEPRYGTVRRYLRADGSSWEGNGLGR